MDNQQPSDNSLFYKKPHKGMGFVYKYTSPSGKNYIGQTISSLADRAKSIKKAIERNGKSAGYYWRIIEGSTTKCP